MFGKAESFAYWFFVECENSWVFRAVILEMALVLLATVSYGIAEVWRTLRPGPRADEIAKRLFYIWLILFETFVVFVAVLYVLGLKIEMV